MTEGLRSHLAAGGTCPKPDPVAGRCGSLARRPRERRVRFPLAGRGLVTRRGVRFPVVTWWERLWMVGNTLGIADRSSTVDGAVAPTSFLTSGWYMGIGSQWRALPAIKVGSIPSPTGVHSC